MRSFFVVVARFVKNYGWLNGALAVAVVAAVLSLTGKAGLAQWILAIGTTVCALPIVWDIIQSIRYGKYGVDILALTAVVASVLLRQYWAGIIIVIMFLGGRALEDYAQRRAKAELTDLLKRAPKKARLLKGGKTVDILASAVKVRDKLLIKPGELIPVDAVIVDGEASIDESSLTGESLPVEKKAGDELLSGSVNLDGVLTVKALRVAADSQYEQIIKLVRNATSHQSPFVRLADRYSIPFTITAYVIAVSVWIVSGDPMRFLEVIVVATPCPLLLAAPIALVSGMSRAARHGIIVKSGSALEKLAETHTMAFDKTGTLTMGKPVVGGIKTFNDFSKDEVLALAASVEQNSNHTLARTMVAAAAGRELKLIKVKDVREQAGSGVSGTVKHRRVLVGNATLLAGAGVSLPARVSRAAAATTALIAIDGKLAGAIHFSDEPRPESKATLRRLKELGIRHILMITGDNKASAQIIAKKVGITEVQADCLPADKLHAVEDIKHRPVAFVGDGVNDAPVLTTADVGIALGAKGSAAASESADVVIMLDDLGHVATAVDIAKRTFFIAKQSIFVGIFISLGLMLVFATGRFSPVSGALIQELVDVIVIVNALRALGSWHKRQPVNSAAEAAA